MRLASRPRPRPLILAAFALAGVLAAPGAWAAAAPATTTLSAGAPPPTHTGPTPRASADARRMFAVTVTNLVVFENGAGYLHAFWRTLGTAGPDSPARLQWGRGCPDVSERTYAALLTAFSDPERFLLIVDKSPDARQPGAFCISNVELERIHAPSEARPAGPAPGAPPPLLKK